MNQPVRCRREDVKETGCDDLEWIQFFQCQSFIGMTKLSDP